MANSRVVTISMYVEDDNSRDFEIKLTRVPCVGESISLDMDPGAWKVTFVVHTGTDIKSDAQVWVKRAPMPNDDFH